jgi:hypothetical protein
MSRSIQNVAIPKALAADLASKAGAVALSLNKFIELALTAFLRTGCNLTPIFSRPDPIPSRAELGLLPPTAPPASAAPIGRAPKLKDFEPAKKKKTKRRRR